VSREGGVREHRAQSFRDGRPRDVQCLPVAVIGAGPVGLAVTAHLWAREQEVIVLEAGSACASAVRQWAHVRLFSPWSQLVDPLCARLLQASGWRPAAGEALPTGGELVMQYLEPLAERLRPHLRLDTRVTGVSRLGGDRAAGETRKAVPLLVRVHDRFGERDLLARAVVDASGTYETPNWLGASGLPARGESELRDYVAYRIPSAEAEGDRYRGRRVAVVGSGHPALNALLELASLKPSVDLTWIVRPGRVADPLARDERNAGGQLPARAELARRVRVLVERGRIRPLALRVDEARRGRDGIRLGEFERLAGPFDQIVALTGLRPNLAMLRELRLALDPASEAPLALAPLIDANLHSCATVPAHGAAELAHPEPDFYIVGIKSYGRAPTFLLKTGYEQVASVASELSYDTAAKAKATGARAVDEAATEQCT